MKKIKSIHFMGIKGVGMTPLAIIAKEAGFKVTGSDVLDEFITDQALKKAGIIPFVGFSKENIKNPDLVIFTGAHGGLENIEVQHAKYTGIPVMTQGEAVGVFMKGKIFGRSFEGISIAGCHGKTTTTAILATILSKSGLNPSFTIGTGNIPSLGSPGHYGKGKYFIAEADEYATEPTFDKTVKFLWQHPKITIFTNIEFDHPDLFNSIDDIRNAFLQFAQNLPNNGVLIVCGDDPQIQRLLQNYTGRVVKFGKSPNNDYIIKKISFSGGQTFFWVDAYGTSLGEFRLSVLGEHNVFNALGAIIGVYECGLDFEKIKKVLPSFVGSKRRFEYIGKLFSGALLFDDYAHHPTEIKKTLKAFRQSFPKAQIICIFQPHTYSRTKILFDQFINSFFESDVVIVTNIYPSLREKPDPTVSSKLLVEGISQFHKEALFLPKLSDVVEYIEQKQPDKNTIVISMGAGDVYKIASSLLIPSV